MLKTIYKYIKN